jgi:putative tryptophan/tyrosine transport system substrate-binding protein
MRRRDFIAGLGGAATAWPFGLPALAQQSGRLPTIGYLISTTAATSSQTTAAVLQRLRELGWVDGRNIAIEYRSAEGSTERFAEIAVEFVQLKVDVIHVTGNLPALVAKRATSVIPIIFVLADPVATGLVASLAQPGGNVTGLSSQLTDAAGKRVELLREVVPSLRRLAVMANFAPESILELGEVREAAGKLGLEVSTQEIRRRQDISLAFDAFKGRADALYVANSALLASNKMEVNTLALGARLPTMYANRSWLEVGGLMSFGPNFLALFRRSADFVDKILRGAKPADIPVEQPTKFDLAINLFAAKALGLTIPEAFLLRADEVIE